MKLTNLVKIVKYLQSLENGWDGYNAGAIKPDVIKKVSNMSYMNSLIKQFIMLGFHITDIDLTPISDGTVQLEAEKDGMCLEIWIKGDNK